MNAAPALRATGAAAVPRVLVFEPQHGGHHPTFVRMLAAELGRAGQPFTTVFAVPDALIARLRREDAFDLGVVPGTEILRLSAADAAACETGSLLARGMARWRLLQRCVVDARADHATAPFFDPLQLPLALGRRLPRHASVSGILFRPSVHDVYATSGRPSLAERVRDARKRALYALTFRNSCLSFLLTLDPLFPAHAARHYRHGDRVRVIPDPAVDAPPRSAEPPADDLAEALATDRLVFAMFGALTDRKGVLQTLASLESLDPAVRARIRVLFAGEVDPGLRPAVQRALERLRRSAIDEAAWRLVDRRLTTSELAGVVDRADVVLAPYQRFVGSSGVLTWAAAGRKPVIAQDCGLVGALVRQHSLGVATDTTDPRRIAAAIQDLASRSAIAEWSARAGCAGFLAGRTERDFATTYAGALRDVLRAEGRIAHA
jgi:glycosyltransferase involved in cell wall biosynthesis